MAVNKITSFIMSVLLFFSSILLFPWFFTPAPVPAVLSEYTEKPTETVVGDFYVSPNGSDEGDGSLSSPFKTIERAIEAVRSLDKTGKDSVTVCIMAGEYRTNGLVFTAADGGTESCPINYCAFGDGEAVINGGFSLTADDFSPVSGEAAERLKSSVRDKVLKANLFELGLTAEEIGEMKAIGTYNTAHLYGKGSGVYCELFFADRRMTLARYPNSGEFLKTGDVVYNSLEENNAPQGWSGYTNPSGDKFKMDENTASRAASWSTLDDVWMMGYWRYDWADGSTPVKSVSGGTIETAYASNYGIRKDAPYYFFNVLEELDSPGEYYIDREAGILYFYPDKDLSQGEIFLTITQNPVIKSNADYLIFENLTIQGTRGDSVSITANNNIVKGCTVKNIGGTAVVANGCNNLITECEVYHTGRGGIYLYGGDRERLIPGNNKADNNYIHDWSEIYLTYQPGVRLNGVGNICSHNEMCRSPHEAITYSGNNHIIEYNEIYEVVLRSEDAGAIYAGRSWTDYGTVIRYNCIYNLGSGGYSPNGIYLDDGLSGQSVYGNLLINVPGYGLMLGGGRDLSVKNNIVIGSQKGIYYDARVIEGVLDENFWFKHGRKGQVLWTGLYNSPWQTDIWKEAFPQMSKISDDFDDAENPYFGPNPAFSVVSDNIVISKSPVPSIGTISPFVTKYSAVEHNSVINFGAIHSVFPGIAKGDYTMNANSAFLYQLSDDFEILPLSEIGRY
ncbi:MAG: right-handed parallel beta-helix repeat-containing protein [Clostridiales bacterium]|nr:right-handed parallel beta-helix repeat-containing protein [Clostridiales bacterium]